MLNSAILSGLTQDVLPSDSADMLGQHSTDTLIMYCFYIHIYMQTHAHTDTHTRTDVGGRRVLL